MSAANEDALREMNQVKVWTLFQPRDQSLPAQPISIQNVQSRKKAHKPLHTSCISQKNVSAIFDNHTIFIIVNMEWTNLSHVLAAWSAFLALFTWSWCATCAKDHGFFILVTHKSNKVRKSNPWKYLTRDKNGIIGENRQTTTSWENKENKP